MATLEQALSLAAGLPRPDIEALVDAAINLLDLLDGDADLEDDDPAGGDPDDEGEDCQLLPLMPVYECDQSKGPLNEREGYAAWQLAQHRRGDRLLSA